MFRLFRSLKVRQVLKALHSLEIVYINTVTKLQNIASIYFHKSLLFKYLKQKAS